MKNSIKLSLKIISFFALCASSNQSMSMFRRACNSINSKIMPTISTAQQSLKNYTGIYLIAETFTLWDHIVALSVSKKSAFFKNPKNIKMTGLYDSYMNELDQSPKEGKGRFDRLGIIHEKYIQEYLKHQDDLYLEILNYHQQRYPLVRKELEASPLTNAYDEYLKLFIANPKHSQGMELYAALCNCINLLEAEIEPLEKIAHERNQLKQYITDYIEKNSSKKRYQLSDITFHEYDPYTRKFHNNKAHYNPNSQVLNFGPLMYKEPLSVIAYTIMHEVEHVSQDPYKYYAGIDDPFGAEPIRAKIEHEAETQAVKECNCCICLKIVQSETNDSLPDGYFRKKDYDPFIQDAEKTNKRCKAHTDHNTTELEKALETHNAYKIKQLDNAMGTIYDRLPSV